MNISIERLQEIEEEREQTQMNPDFQQWFKQLNVSKFHVSKEGILNANQMMDDWGNYSQFIKSLWV